MKKILITGANGFLGQHLCLFLARKNFQVVATGKGPCRLPAPFCQQYIEVDLQNGTAVQNLLQTVKPNVIIHAAALSKPDACEQNRKLCLAINVEATHYLLQQPTDHFIYVSTDFVFGDNGPHSEDGVTEPLNFYGLSKLMAEEAVLMSGNFNTIVRPVFIYDKLLPGMRGSFLHWVKDTLQQQKRIKVVSDQARTPTLATDICRGITAIIDQQVAGVFHLAGKDILSPYDMAITTAQYLKLDTALVEKVTADTFAETVQRAKRSGLKIDKAQKILGYEPVSFAEGLRLTFG